ncbi:MAG TPA: ParB/RepB/Spo0J family partition protein, partial [Rhodothermales bacterium]
EKSPRRKALGRGLNALLSSTKPAPSAPETSAEDRIHRIPLRQIDPSPDQPRQIFRDEGIEELAQSIRVDGLIQPIVVRPNGDRFQLIVGERRWRAAKIAGINEIPCIVQEFEKDRALEIALVENIQREDLNPIEVASALNRMVHEFQLSHEELATRTGKDRTTITNLLRLLKLPQEIQQLVAERRISMGHARALLSIDNPEAQLALAEKAAAHGMSVRDVERRVRAQQRPSAEKDETKPVDPNIAAALEEMERALGTRVRLVQRNPSSGRIEIEYHSQEDIDRIYARIVGD